jgi:hypothetical protein
VPLAVGNDQRLERAPAQRRSHGVEIERRDDVVRDYQDLLGRDAVEVGLAQQVGPDVDGVAA